MKHFILTIILFGLLVSEGVALELLPESIINLSSIIVPHWLLIFLVLINFFNDGDKSYVFIIYAIIFGLLVDIVYTDILGVYMFAYGISLFISTLLKRILQENIIMAILTGILSIITAEAVISGVYTIINITNVYWLDNLFDRLFPTIIANVIFLIVIYPIVKYIFSKYSNEAYN